MRVYLAGPINGCTDEECDGWRERCKRELPQIEWLDPTDHDYRGQEKGNEQNIVKDDKQMILRSHFVLANCWKPGWGTAMEIMFAHLLGIPVVSVSENPSPWIVVHSKASFPSIGAALGFIKEVY